MLTDDDVIYVQNSQSTCREENNGTFTLYNPNTDILTTVSRMGKHIIDLFDGTTTISEIYTMVCQFFNEYATDIGKQDFVKFLEKVSDRGLIVSKSSLQENEA
jgi:hypothetical protein